ncbi:MAG: hypothetical protein ACRDOH_29700 [Streptosporangiaceae bacterium]
MASQLAALAVEDGAGQGVAPLTAAEQVVDGAAVGRVVGVLAWNSYSYGEPQSSSC